MGFMEWMWIFIMFVLNSLANCCILADCPALLIWGSSCWDGKNVIWIRLFERLRCQFLVRVGLGSFMDWTNWSFCKIGNGCFPKLMVLSSLPGSLCTVQGFSLCNIWDETWALQEVSLCNLREVSLCNIFKASLRHVDICD